MINVYIYFQSLIMLDKIISKSYLETFVLIFPENSFREESKFNGCLDYKLMRGAGTCNFQIN